jgi:hypothetical protein
MLEIDTCSESGDVPVLYSRSDQDGLKHVEGTQSRRRDVCTTALLVELFDIGVLGRELVREKTSLLNTISGIREERYHKLRGSEIGTPWWR